MSSVSNTTLFYFVLLALAVFRVSIMIALEDGPADVFTKLREKAGQKNWIGRGLNCPLCISFWAGLTASLVFTSGLMEWPFVFWIVAGFALSGITVIAYRVVF
jgi:hypothetical protein